MRILNIRHVISKRVTLRKEFVPNYTSILLLIHSIVQDFLSLELGGIMYYCLKILLEIKKFDKFFKVPGRHKL
jgi:hypothetical protein